jgi:hypothetical protein
MVFSAELPTCPAGRTTKVVRYKKDVHFFNSIWCN